MSKSFLIPLHSKKFTRKIKYTIIWLCCSILLSYRSWSFRFSIGFKVQCVPKVYTFYTCLGSTGMYTTRHVSCTLPTDFGSPYAIRDTVDKRRSNLYSRLAVSVDPDEMGRYLRRWNRRDLYNMPPSLPPPPPSSVPF